MEKATYDISPETGTERLDIFISLKSGLSRSNVQRLIKKGLITVNAKTEKPNYKVRTGDRIELTIPDEPPVSLVPENRPIDVIWEDRHIAVINKPPGMIVHPAAGHVSGTLLNALISKYKKLASTGAPLRPGVVHRLDRDTSGLIIVARDDPAYMNLIRQFSERKVEKHYLALLYGNPGKDSGEISVPIGRSVSDRKRMSTKTKRGKEAVTIFKVIKKFQSAALVKVRIITGRTHQIRVHFAASGHPVLGDKTYGKKTTLKSKGETVSFNRQMLHANTLKFKHPVTGKSMELTAPVPEDMKKAIEELS